MIPLTVLKTYLSKQTWHPQLRYKHERVSSPHGLKENSLKTKFLQKNHQYTNTFLPPSPLFFNFLFGEHIQNVQEYYNKQPITWNWYVNILKIFALSLRGLEQRRTFHPRLYWQSSYAAPSCIFRLCPGSSWILRRASRGLARKPQGNERWEAESKEPTPAFPLVTHRLCFIADFIWKKASAEPTNMREEL